MTSLVVGRDGDIDKFERGIGVTKSDDRNVNIGCFSYGLVINSRVCDDDKTGFPEQAGDVVGERTESKTTRDSLGACVGSVFQDGAVTVRACGYDTDIVRVLDSCDTCGKDKLLPGPSLSDVDDMNASNISCWLSISRIQTSLLTIRSPFPYI